MPNQIRGKGTSRVSSTRLGEKAFQRCSALTSLTLPNSLTVIERCAFRECWSLTSLKLPGPRTLTRLKASCPEPVHDHPLRAVFREPELGVLVDIMSHRQQARQGYRERIRQAICEALVGHIQATLPRSAGGI